ncbi:hypothetical protein NM688_g4987 [Phlebia brevispora]|uniref:Uncharacterized protein n=1 Tax=Phlebia brevispora TaxID=194682 RepID=A0ACC1T1B1_9APHY|nr:hypothetical protein NM688_g4987 [Phlebia brevispora]
MSTNNNPTPIWWSNAIFFLSTHLATLVGVYYRPIWATSSKTLVLTVVLWQLASLGITVGYHRLYSHRSFRATPAIRAVFALLGASACQGSIEWWVVRHRLHHRYTDDPVHDPYAATRGLLWSHFGWIFFKPQYERMDLIDRKDLKNDQIARLQHKYYMPTTLFTAFVAPALIGTLWNDAFGAFIWASLVKTLLVWHCTFLINSLAHWDGIQPYSDENTSKTNVVRYSILWSLVESSEGPFLLQLLAILTCGEGNHNFHTFPYDFRSGPSTFEWDPSKWIILALHYLGLVGRLRRAKQEDIDEAKRHMLIKSGNAIESGYSSQGSVAGSDEHDHPDHPAWTLSQAQVYARERAGHCLVVLDGFILDVTTYLGEHPGGAQLLWQYALPKDDYRGKCETYDQSRSQRWKQATWAFFGGLNVHSRRANKRLQEFIVAKLIEGKYTMAANASVRTYPIASGSSPLDTDKKHLLQCQIFEWYYNYDSGMPYGICPLPATIPGTLVLAPAALAEGWHAGIRCAWTGAIRPLLCFLR